MDRRRSRSRWREDTFQRRINYLGAISQRLFQHGGEYNKREKGKRRVTIFCALASLRDSYRLYQTFF
jgi:hypothetical protein